MSKRTILAGLLLMMLAGAVTAAPLVKGDVKAGQAKSATCAGCHGADGNSASAQFPKLAGQSAAYIFEQLQLFKSGKRKNAIMNGMAGGLTTQDMKNLAVYFSSQKIKPDVVKDEKLAQKGAKIYHGGLPEFKVPACSGCHGPSGLGNPAAKYPRISGQHAEYIAKQLMAYRTGERSGYENAKIMHGVTRGLSDDDIKALAAYVSALMPTGPEQNNTSGALFQNPPAPEPKKDKAGSGAGKSGDSGSANS